MRRLQETVRLFIMKQASRESRLRKAALVFLVAASAALLIFSGINALAVNLDPPVRKPMDPLNKIKGINITQMGPYYPQTTNAVEGGWHAVYLSTDRPFWRVAWYVNGHLEFIDRASYDGQTDSFFGHQYQNGSKTGEPATVKAIAYPRFFDPLLMTGDSDTMTVKVFRDNGFIWRETDTEIRSIVPLEEEHNYNLRTIHYASYYNDTGKVQTSEITTNMGWAHGHDPDPGKLARFVDKESWYDARDKRAFDSMAVIPRTLDATLNPGTYYGVYGYTKFSSDKIEISKSAATSGPGVRYDKDMSLPPVGQSDWKKNESEDAEFLFE